VRNVLSRVTAAARRDALVGFATLLLLMAGYTTLETARDALFLASIPASRLPWAYLAVAALAFVATNLLDEIGQGHRRATLVGWILGSAVLTAAFFVFVRGGSETSLYALYAWGGVLTTVVLTRFWALLASRFTVVQAKTVYPFIGAGSVVGALVGTGLSGLLTTTFDVPGQPLLLVAAGLLAAAGLAPLWLDASDDGDDDPARRTAQSVVGTQGLLLRNERSDRPGRSDLLAALRETYPRRVVLMVVLSAFTLTVVDFVFKAAVADAVAPDDLAGFFARIYFALNVLSLLVQVVLVRLTVRWLTVTGALAVLPVLLVVGGAFFAVGSGITAALALKTADGALRHSLHRTAIELLYVPMAPRARAAVKTFADVVGQRGGQALASLALLGLLAAGVLSSVQNAVVIGLPVVWVVLALLLRSPYLDLFRHTLRNEARRGRPGFPELDRSSLEALIAALNSVNDREVLAALDSLVVEGKVRLVPALILYHPSEEVVVHALDLLADHGRSDIVPIIGRLLDARADTPSTIRAAALRARVTLGVDPAFLRSFLHDDSPDVRATALVGLAAFLEGRLAEAQDALDELVRTGQRDARLAVAHAIAHRPQRSFDDLILTLSRDDDPDVRSAAVDAMRASPSPAFEERLCELLRYRATRPRARQALVALGDRAFDVLADALRDEDRPASERRHVPRTLMLFAPPKAAEVLVARYPAEHDRIVQHKILRALAFLQEREDGVRFDGETLHPLLKRAVSRALELRDRRLILESGARGDERLATRYHRMLVRLLRDIESAKVDQVFSILVLERPDEDVRAIQRGLQSGRRDVRAGAAELLEHVVPSDFREPLLALANPDEPDEGRAVRLGTDFHRPLDLGYAETIEDLLGDRNEAVRSLAVYQAGVLGMRELLPEIRAIEASRDGLLDEAVRRVQEQLAAATRPAVAEVPSS